MYTSLYHDHADHVTCFICLLFGSHHSRFLMVNCGESNSCGQHVFSTVGLLPTNLQHRSWQFVDSPADRINHGWLRRPFSGMRPYEVCQVMGLKEIANAIEKASATKWGTLSCSCESDQTVVTWVSQKGRSKMYARCLKTWALLPKSSDLKIWAVTRKDCLAWHLDSQSPEFPGGRPQNELKSWRFHCARDSRQCAVRRAGSKSADPE